MLRGNTPRVRYAVYLVLYALGMGTVVLGIVLSYLKFDTAVGSIFCGLGFWVMAFAGITQLSEKVGYSISGRSVMKCQGW